MKKRFTEEQIIKAVRRVDAGESVKVISRELGVTPTTVYIWRKKFSGMDVSEAKKMRALESENSRLKRLVADQALDIAMLKKINSKKW